ncbi:MAG TPA: ABC transporter ATP-binding protein [Dehalococcoidia bacterium]|nr:ABC transporter ATP-binding protein [Dehalococcoidia bacterium]
MEATPLQVCNITKSFGDSTPALLRWTSRRTATKPRPVVDGVSFEVRRGEVYGVLGANGSGKSTLVRMISTLLLPDAGGVRIFDIDAVNQPGKVRGFINRVSADPSFFKNMSTYENLLFFGRIYGMTRGEVVESAPRVLGRMGLDWGKAHEPMSNLSRGQQQKVAIARSVLTSPVLMLLDEPTTGLDPRSKREVQSFIQEIRSEHDATVLLTTHDMEEAETLCSRIGFLAHGKVVAEGTPLELRQLVAQGRPVEDITMDTVFMELTGQSIEDDEAAPEGDS